MSGSYDRPDRPPMRGLDPHRAPDYDPYDDLVTQGVRTGAPLRTDYAAPPYEAEPISGEPVLRSDYEPTARAPTPTRPRGRRAKPDR